MSNFLTDALAYAARGWSIIPIKHRPGTGGKQPDLPSWKQFQTVRPTDVELREWFARGDLDGLAVIVGDVSGGLCCRDFDRASDYEAWVLAYPDLARTLPTVETARGFHVYFIQHGQANRNVTGVGEVKGRNVYALLPPSIHPTGVLYQWKVPPGVGPPKTIDPNEAGLCVTSSHGSAIGSVGGRNDPEDPTDPTDPIAVCSPSRLTAEDAVRRYIVTKPGTHDSQTMIFARTLKFQCGVNNPADPLALTAFKAWWKESKVNCADRDEGTALDKFQRALVTAHMPPDTGSPFAAVWLAVGDGPYGDGIERLFDDPKPRRLVATFQGMGSIMGGGSWCCSSYQIARVLGRPDHEAYRYHRWKESIVRMGIVECVDRGYPGFGGSGAARYRWVGLKHLHPE